MGSSIDQIQPGSVEFILEGDEQALWRSGIMTQGDEAIDIEVDITDIEVLTFNVTDGGDGNSGDVANWCEAYITYSDEVPRLVPEGYSSSMDKGLALNEVISSRLSELPEYTEPTVSEDWLISKPGIKAEVFRKGNKDIVLSNGLAGRTFRILPNVATTSLKNLVTQEEYIRSLEPEANLLLDSVEFPIGGLSGQVEKGFLRSEWIDNFHSTPGSFQVVDFKVTEITERINWRKKRWLPSTQWHQSGKELTFYFEAPPGKFSGVRVEVHYELYDGIPLFSKWLVVISDSSRHTINHFTGEIIAHHEAESHVDNPEIWRKPNLYV
ncbi:MAG: NPCBM/NEW2 domain-containing protein, partial [Proteobacteria bacterium]|nr:NPCBM/NEW2 domain-containing protein [Pseudomonadota bacterium]